jgi:hypothetical protein
VVNKIKVILSKVDVKGFKFSTVWLLGSKFSVTSHLNVTFMMQKALVSMLQRKSSLLDK